MDQDNINKPFLNNEGRGMKVGPYTEALIEVLSHLNDQANDLIDNVFAIQKINDIRAKKNYIKNADKKAECLLLKDHETQTTTLNQNKTSTQEKKSYHTDQSLTYARSVIITYEKKLKHAAIYMDDICSLKNIYKNMLARLFIAQKNISALEIIINIDQNPHTKRARKGGYSKNNPASKNDEYHLLEIMVKNIIYNEIDLLPKAQKNQNSTRRISESISKRIYEVNKSTNILTFNNLDKIINDIEDIIIEKIKKKSKNGHWSHRLEYNLPFRNRDAIPRLPILDPIGDKIEAEIEYKNGYIFGQINFLKAIIEKKFGTPTDPELKTLMSITKGEHINKIYSQIDEANNWKSVLEIKDKY